MLVYNIAFNDVCAVNMDTLISIWYSNLYCSNVCVIIINQILHNNLKQKQ